MQLRSHLQQQFPGLQVSGGNHPVAPSRQYIASALQVVQYLGIALIFVGDRYVFPALNVPTPAWYTSLTQNRMGSAMGLFVVGNVVIGNLQTSGAFEVYYDGALLWSKLATGQPPNTYDIAESLHHAMTARA